MPGQSTGARLHHWMEYMVLSSVSAGYRSGDSSVSHQRKGRKIWIVELFRGKKMKLSNDYSWKNSEVSGSFLCLWLASTPAVTLALRVSVVCVGWGSGKGGGCSSLWMSLAAAGRPSL